MEKKTWLGKKKRLFFFLRKGKENVCCSRFFWENKQRKWFVAFKKQNNNNNNNNNNNLFSKKILITRTSLELMTMGALLPNHCIGCTIGVWLMIMLIYVNRPTRERNLLTLFSLWDLQHFFFWILETTIQRSYV